jgi:hypothetical protein
MTSTRDNLKAVFKTGSIPKEQDFADLIDASVNQADDGFLIVEKDGKKNVGVGVEVPQAKLHVGGDLMVDSGLTVEGVANIPNMLKIGSPAEPTLSKLQVEGGATIDSLIISADGKKEWMILDSSAQRLYVNSEYDSNGKPCKLRVGAAWGMPGLYSGDYSGETSSTDLVLGAPPQSKIYFGENKNDAWIESGTGNAYIKGIVGIGTPPDAASKKLQVKGGVVIDSLTISENVEVRGKIIRSVTAVTANGPGHTTGNGELPSRKLTFTKVYEETRIRIFYCDNFRIMGNEARCRYEILVDGKPIPGDPIYADRYGSSGNYHEQSTIFGYAKGIKSGKHTISIQLTSEAPCEVYTGWDNSTWSIEAEEVWLT